MTSAAHFRSLWDEVLGRYRWIVCADVAAAFAPMMKFFQEAGAPTPLLLAGSEGTGPQPDPAECDLIVLGTTSDTMLGGIRAYHDALRDLPGHVLDRIDAWDPDGEARVMQSFLDTRYPVAGRTPWGSRPEHWLTLEDKMVVDDLWDDIGIAREPIEIVPPDEDELNAASRRVDSGAGVVWTADNRDGWHGGAEYSRFIADPSRADDALAFMRDHASRIRVMPFLEGVPCAIHGLVGPDAIATFRPVEMVVFRQARSDRFRYASCATSWDPDPKARQEMRDVARRVGNHLRASHEFRGAFTVDGVLTHDGFRPTELNPRYGAGIGTISRASDVPMLGLSRMLIEGEHDEIDLGAVEQVATAAADESRTLAGFTTTSIRTDETEEVRVRWDGQAVTVSDDGNATLTRGPATHGSMVRFSLDPEATPPGVQAAPVVAAGFRLADDLWGLDIGDLISATPA